jgi:5-methylcytosine-specific restriction endonuclease McrA
MIITESRSKSGHSRSIHIIINEPESPQSFSSYILLKNNILMNILNDIDNLRYSTLTSKEICHKKFRLSIHKNKSIFLKNKKHICNYCKKDLLPDQVTIDHIIPISNGGYIFNWNNLAISCKRCNINKKSQTVEEFIKK